jgi:DNA-directed RNA polymerase specialized sigma24 family protein
MQQTLDELCSLCRAQVQRFRRGEDYDDAFCMEIFRRAIVGRDNDCWRELQSIYKDQVVSWCRRGGSGVNLSLEDLAALTWERFWLSFGPEKFALANGTPAIQRYLKACTFSTVIDTTREQRGTLSLNNAPYSDSGEEGLTLADSLVDASPTPEESLLDNSRRNAFRELVQNHTTSDKEKTLLYLKYQLGLSSAEVQKRRPDLFPAVNEVYRVTRNLLDRLRRSPEMAQWFHEGN